ncbi:MAG: CinA family nicotinamide mononucleotide deamidase-related protein, partial [Planctomycetes bacterium]|nr:CinA family nicotinamide mononucleotide deamidase-related protein [Planctomycetota bacterium]
MQSTRPMRDVATADVMAMGTELTTGAICDSNSAWISARLAELGVSTRRHITVADDQACIAYEIRESVRHVRLVVATGGLGPTADDLTRDALAEAADARLVCDDVSLREIEAFFASISRRMPDSNRRQAMVPVGAKALSNEWGTAPGIEMRIGESLLFAIPGVPREMKAMFERYIEPAVRSMAGREQTTIRVLHTFGAGESSVAEQIGDLMQIGRNPSVGTTASEGVISVRIVATASGDLDSAALAGRDVDDVRKRLGPLVYGEGCDTLASVVGRQLIDCGQTVSTAESCTGGLLSAMLTDISGSSAYYLGGFVTYSNEQKIATLGVSHETIEQHGAVSEQTAAAMAERCREKVQTDYALA